MADTKTDPSIFTAQAMTTDLPLVPVTATAQEAAAMLGEAAVTLLPVGEDDRVVGCIDVRDLAVKCCASGLDPRATPVGDLMSPGPFDCRPDMPAAEAVRMMRRHAVSAAPVRDGDDRFVGVVFLHRLLDWLDDDRPHGPEPEHVRRVRGDTF